MTASHAQIAKEIVAKAPAGVFARACSEVVTGASYLTLERMLPGVKFASRKTGPDQWELVGTCTDGSVCIWGIGA